VAVDIVNGEGSELVTVFGMMYFEDSEGLGITVFNTN
jgi:hypothetical protein